MFDLTLPGKSLFSAPKSELPPPPPPLPTPEDPSIKAKADKTAAARKRASGLTSTIKTSDLGDTSGASVSRKTLGA